MFALRVAFQRLLTLTNHSMSGLIDPRSGTSDIVRRYDFVTQQSYGQKAEKAQLDPFTVNWIIPDFGIGSGGHSTIFRFVAGFEKSGFKCRIIIVGDCSWESGQIARDAIREHFFLIDAPVNIGPHTIEPAWFTVATSWKTAYILRDYQHTREKYYFVQDFEPHFYAHGSEYALAEQTYRFGFAGVTAGTWLSEKLLKEYGMHATPFSFSYATFPGNKQTPKTPGTRQVFFYVRPETPRRGFELGLLILAEVAKRFPDLTFVLAGGDITNFYIPFRHVNAGVVSAARLTELYHQCDVALILSFTNLSLAPLEAMAAGCAVVTNDGPNVEWLLHNDVAVIVPPGIWTTSRAIINLLEDDERRLALIERARRFASKTDWDQEVQNIVEVFRERTTFTTRSQAGFAPGPLD